MKILLLEPHGDDALLSCNSLLETDNDIDIYTFADYRSSEGLKSYYSSIRNTKYLENDNLWYEEGKFPWSTHQVHRRYLNGENIYQIFVEKIKERFNDLYEKSLDSAYKTLINSVNVDNYDLVVCPTGIVHPYHLVVSKIWRKINKDNEIPTLYYADKHYIQNRYGKELYESARLSLNLDREINSGYVELNESVDNSKISDALCRVYPTEKLLLRFYSNIILKIPCKYSYNSKNIDIINLLKLEG